MVKEDKQVSQGIFILFNYCFKQCRQDHSTYVVILKGLLLLLTFPDNLLPILQIFKRFFLNSEELIRTRFHLKNVSSSFCTHNLLNQALKKEEVERRRIL